jgi:superfamily II DNA or RNA helicase
MIFNQLNLGYLSSYIGIDNYNLTKESYELISEDGHFSSDIKDKQLAVLLFESIISDDFFFNRKNLIEFVQALPGLTQSRILQDLELDSISEIKWNKRVSDYFINEHNLNSKFEFRKTESKDKDTGYSIFEEPSIKFKKLKRFQSDVFFQVYEYVSKTPFARAIIQMPTGSGKTRTAMEIVCETMNDTNRDVLWLANTEELCDQAYESFIEVWKFLGKTKASAINHLRSNTTPDKEEDFPSFHVSTLQSFNSRAVSKRLKSFGISKKDLELLIVDEAHISVAPVYQKSIESLISEGAKLVGLTATPGRQLHKTGSNVDAENIKLSDFYFNMKFELDSGDILPIEFLRNEGILSNAKFISIEGSRINSLINKSEVKRSLANNKIPKIIEQVLTNNVHRNAIIFDQLIQLLKQNKKILFFGTSIVHSKLMTTLINLKGYKAAHIDGNTGRYRRSIIQSFKKNELDILCNYGVLSTGFDDPKIDVVFMARPTNSIVLYSQIIGRGLRGPLIGGTDYCEIFTVVDNIVDLPDNNEIYSYFDDYFIQ